MKLSISPNPKNCISKQGGVNSVINDHTIGFLSRGHEIVETSYDVHILHALANDGVPDVYHCHGLYPIGEDHFDKTWSRANDIVLDNAIKAKKVVCVSNFSANILRHKLHVNPIVSRNGIWTEQYQRGGNKNGSILFPKLTIDATSRNEDMLWLKEHTKYPLLSVAKIDGIKHTGMMNRDEFISTLAGCSIYLGTTKENNSMGTMEAMIMGIPIVGYNVGFNAERLVDGIGCKLVSFDCKSALNEAISEVLDNWNFYSENAHSYAKMFDWMPVIEELEDIYESVQKNREKDIVSIVIPCHNYSKWVGEAIESALKQSVSCEVIVIDDASTDKSLSVIEGYEVTVMHNDVNLGVAESRNRAIDIAAGNLIVCLDADDRLLPNFVEEMLKCFHTKKDAIACSPVALINEEGEWAKRSMFVDEPNAFLHSTGRNQIPSCCMFRKSWWKKAGGYNKTYSPAEDAHLWLEILQLGGHVKQASRRPLMEYRVHGGSLSANGFPKKYWEDTHININDPIEERDPAEILVIIEGNTNAKDTLWSLENQTYKRWNCLLREPNGLRQSFPWLNQPVTSQNESVIHVKSGEYLHPNFLWELAEKKPYWMEPR